MKKPTTHLFQMIRSLTPAEKRYFKIYASKHVIGTKNNYEKLFDALDNWEAEYYEEALFLKANARQPYAKYFADEKKHLEELLFEAMRNYNGSKSVSGRLNDMLADERFCRDKRLNELRLKIIARAKELAYKYERWGTLLELLDREATAVLEIKQEDMLGATAKVEREIDQVTGVYNVYLALKKCNNNMFALIRAQTGHSTQVIKQQAEKIMQHVQNANYMPGSFFSADVYYYHVHIWYNRLVRNFPLCHQYSTVLLQCYNKWPHFKASNAIGYKIDLFNYLNSCHNVQQYEHFETVFEQVKGMPAISPDEEGEEWQNMVHFKLMYYLGTARFKEALGMEKEILHGLKKYAHKVNTARRLTLHYNLFQALFVMEEWQSCLTHLNAVLQDTTEARQDLKNLADVFTLIVQHQLGNFTVADYAIQNLKRRAGKTDMVNAADIAFIKLFEKINRQSRAGQGKLFQQALSIIQSPDNELHLLRNEDILVAWLKSKISKGRIYTFLNTT